MLQFLTFTVFVQDGKVQFVCNRSEALVTFCAAASHRG